LSFRAEQNGLFAGNFVKSRNLLLLLCASYINGSAQAVIEESAAHEEACRGTLKAIDQRHLAI